jgi:hypothetical protein
VAQSATTPLPPGASRTAGAAAQGTARLTGRRSRNRSLVHRRPSSPRRRQEGRSAGARASLPDQRQAQERVCDCRARGCWAAAQQPTLGPGHYGGQARGGGPKRVPGVGPLQAQAGACWVANNDHERIVTNCLRKTSRSLPSALPQVCDRGCMLLPSQQPICLHSSLLANLFYTVRSSSPNRSL